MPQPPLLYKEGNAPALKHSSNSFTGSHAQGYKSAAAPERRRPLLSAGGSLHIGQIVPFFYRDVAPGISHFLEGPLCFYPFAHSGFEPGLETRFSAFFGNPKPDGRIVILLGTGIDIDARHFEFPVGGQDSVSEGRVVLKLPRMPFQLAIILGQRGIHWARSVGTINQRLIVLLENHRLQIVPDIRIDLRSGRREERIWNELHFLQRIRERRRRRCDYELLRTFADGFGANGVVNPPRRISDVFRLPFVAGFDKWNFRFLSIKTRHQHELSGRSIQRLRMKLRRQAREPALQVLDEEIRLPVAVEVNFLRFAQPCRRSHIHKLGWRKTPDVTPASIRQ